MCTANTPSKLVWYQHLRNHCLHQHHQSCHEKHLMSYEVVHLDEHLLWAEYDNKYSFRFYCNVHCSCSMIIWNTLPFPQFTMEMWCGVSQIEKPTKVNSVGYTLHWVDCCTFIWGANHRKSVTWDPKLIYLACLTFGIHIFIESYTYWYTSIENHFSIAFLSITPVNVHSYYSRFYDTQTQQNKLWITCIT